VLSFWPCLVEVALRRVPRHCSVADITECQVHVRLYGPAEMLYTSGGSGGRDGGVVGRYWAGIGRELGDNGWVMGG